MNKKKLLFILHSSAASGGAEDDIENLLKHLKKNNEYIIHGLFPEGPRKDQYIKFFDKSGTLKWGILPVIFDGLTGYIKYFLKIFIQFYQIWKFTKNEKYDLCLINVAVLLWPIIFLKLLNNKILVFIKETIEPKPVRKLIYKVISFCSVFVVPNSKIIENEFLEFTGNKNIQTVYSCVDEINEKKCSEEEFKSFFGPKVFEALNCKDALKLLMVANLTKIKNPIIVAKSILELKETTEINPTLFIAGSPHTDSRYYTYFENFVNEHNINDNIYFLGSQKKDKLSYLYSKADIFIIPSFSEGIPLVLVYALKFRIPVITTNVGGIPDIIKNNYNGVLIKPNENSLTAALKLLFRNEELKNKFIMNGYNTYLEKFKFEENLISIENIIKHKLN